MELYIYFDKFSYFSLICRFSLLIYIPAGSVLTSIVLQPRVALSLKAHTVTIYLVEVIRSIMGYLRSGELITLSSPPLMLLSNSCHII